METDIALFATGYVLARVAIIAAFGYVIYRVVRRQPARIPLKSQSYYAKERFYSTRPNR